MRRLGAMLATATAAVMAAAGVGVPTATARSTAAISGDQYLPAIEGHDAEQVWLTRTRVIARVYDRADGGTDVWEWTEGDDSWSVLQEGPPAGSGSSEPCCVDVGGDTVLVGSRLYLADGTTREVRSPSRLSDDGEYLVVDTSRRSDRATADVERARTGEVLAQHVPAPLAIDDDVMWSAESESATLRGYDLRRREPDRRVPSTFCSSGLGFIAVRASFALVGCTSGRAVVVDLRGRQPDWVIPADLDPLGLGTTFLLAETPPPSDVGRFADVVVVDLVPGHPSRVVGPTAFPPFPAVDTDDGRSLVLADQGGRLRLVTPPTPPDTVAPDITKLGGTNRVLVPMGSARAGYTVRASDDVDGRDVAILIQARRGAGGRPFGAWVTAPQQLPGAALVVAQPGEEWCFRARVADAAGNVSATPPRCSTAPYDDARLRAGDGARRVRDDASYRGGATVLGRRGASLTLPRQVGRAVGVWLDGRRSAGPVAVYVGRRRVATLPRQVGDPRGGHRLVTVATGAFRGTVRLVALDASRPRIGAVAVLRSR